MWSATQKILFSYHCSNHHGQCCPDVAQINLLDVCVFQMALHNPKHADTTKKSVLSLGTGFHSHNSIRRPTLKVAPSVMKANRLMCWAIHPMTRELRALTPPKQDRSKTVHTHCAVHIMLKKKRRKKHVTSCVIYNVIMLIRL